MTLVEQLRDLATRDEMDGYTTDAALIRAAIARIEVGDECFVRLRDHDKDGSLVCVECQRTLDKMRALVRE